MNVYIFKPAECWAYCGGGRVAVAASFDEAVDLFHDGPGNMFRVPGDIPAGRAFHTWELVDEIPTTPTETRRIVLDDFNWS